MKKMIVQTLGKIALIETKKSFSNVSNNNWYQPCLDSDIKQQLGELERNTKATVS